MKKTILLLSLVCTFSLVFAQRDIDESSNWSIKERGYLGLGIGGLGFGSSNTYGRYFSVGVTPMAGYMIAKNLSGGLAFDYQYSNYSDLKITNTVYGLYPFLRYNVKMFFVQVDKDWYSVPVINLRTREKKRETLERFFVGVGYSSPAGQRSAFNILLSYDFQYTNLSAFNSPLSLRMFLTF
jgi:hypothetical protein